MKNAQLGWMWSLRSELVKTRTCSDLTKNQRLRISGRHSLDTLSRTKNDSCRLSRLSKTAHMQRLRLRACVRTGSNHRKLVCAWRCSAAYLRNDKST